LHFPDRIKEQKCNLVQSITEILMLQMKEKKRPNEDVETATISLKATPRLKRTQKTSNRRLNPNSFLMKTYEMINVV